MEMLSISAMSIAERRRRTGVDELLVLNGESLSLLNLFLQVGNLNTHQSMHSSFVFSI